MAIGHRSRIALQAVQHGLRCLLPKHLSSDRGVCNRSNRHFLSSCLGPVESAFEMCSCLQVSASWTTNIGSCLIICVRVLGPCCLYTRLPKALLMLYCLGDSIDGIGSLCGEMRLMGCNSPRVSFSQRSCTDREILQAVPGWQTMDLFIQIDGPPGWNSGLADFPGLSRISLPVDCPTCERSLPRRSSFLSNSTNGPSQVRSHLMPTLPPAFLDRIQD